ncbi:MAG: alpha/beta hydrolase-fold protein [Ferruginibacter sp.]
MKRLLCLPGLIFIALISKAQYTVIFKLANYPLQHSKDSIFISGNFNEWNPHNVAYSLSTVQENSFEFSLQLPAGSYEYKATRGTWKKVECFVNGKDVENHLFEISSDTTIEINIAAWKDDFAGVARKHTASKQVHVIDTSFFIPQLNRNRRIWVYLPEGYSKTKKRYPVLYMQDGQNLFDAATSAYGEWGVDECLDSLIKAGKPACIVIGIDNGPKRFNEYNPYEFQNFGKSEASEYVEFMVETLKPFVDKKYRTLPDRENTIIAGSSLGALVSYYAMLQQPRVFGKAGIFSPAFWTAPPIKSFTDSLAGNVGSKFFFYIGEKEGDAFIKDTQEIQELLGEKSSSMIYSVIDPLGKHNEKAWHKWFPEFYIWMMANGYNTVIKVND